MVLGALELPTGQQDCQKRPISLPPVHLPQLFLSQVVLSSKPFAHPQPHLSTCLLESPASTDALNEIQRQVTHIPKLHLISRIDQEFLNI